MKIGIDARMLGPNVGGGGLGRYVEEFVRSLSQTKSKNRFVLFTKNNEQHISDTFDYVDAPIHWYTLKEQLSMPKLIDSQGLDLMFYPHWNIPLMSRTPFVLTIHDLILLEQPASSKTTTRHPIIHGLKRLGYRLVLKKAVTKSRAIIAPSQYTKDSIIRFFPNVDPNKIHVVYEGLTQLPKPKARKQPTTDLLYVGNAYPHKNLAQLISAYEQLLETHPNLTLTLAGRDTVFYQHLKNLAAHLPNVRFVLSPSDEELAQLYTSAKLYVFPSLSEGFGLPPLEAMSFNLPVVAANTSCLPEILEDAAHWFDPTTQGDLARAINEALTDEDLRTTLIKRGTDQIKKYSWDTMTHKIETILASNG